MQVRQIHYRDQNWHMFINTATGVQHRASQQAYEFIGRCDGVHTVQEIWDELLEQLKDDAPTQDDVVQLLIHLDEQGIFSYETAPDAATLIRRQDERVQKKRKAGVNPFALRIPVGNPTVLLERLEWLARPLVNMYVVWLWLAIVGVALAAIVTNWPALKAHGVAHLATPHYLFLMWISFPVIKALHELGHALAVKRWGGEVRQFGFTLFLLVPAPFVDASDAGGFRHRSQRISVGAAGIMVELALASMALLIWLNVQPGLVRDLAYVVMFIASVSTLLFNGNPLLTFDAYYVLSDAIDVPNLNTRSKSFWNNMLRRIALGRHSVAPEFIASGERKWLWLYFPLSMGYRIFISGIIVVWVGSQSFVIGVAAALFVLITLFVRPLWKTARGLLTEASPGSNRGRAWLTVSGAVAASFLLICVVPLPYHTVAHGVVWLPDQARVRTEINGFVSEFLVPDGDYVEPGRTLLILEDSALISDRDALVSQLRRARTQRYAAIANDRERALKVEKEIARLRGDLYRAEEKIAQLEVRSQVAGHLVMQRQLDLVGTFVKQGSTLGYIFAAEQIGIRAVVPEYDAALVRENTRAIAVRISDRPGEALVAELVRDVPAATRELPSAALGDEGGGPHATDPTDDDGMRTLEPMVMVDLRLPSRTLQRAGGRVRVRFDHGTKPLATQLYRRLTQVFLQMFNPVS